jgi:ATP-dependent DNA helicase RecQ
VRPLVLRTILTYLELEGLLRQGTPFYAGYSFRPVAGSFEDVFARFDGGRADFLRRLVASGKAGRSWTSLDPDAAAAELGEDRDRIVAALGHLEEQGLIEVRATAVHQRYTVLDRPNAIEGLVDRLAERFDRREHAETERIQRVVSLVTHDGCQVNELVGYFGDVRDQPCGHCSFCLDGVAQRLPPSAAVPPVGEVVDVRALAALATAHPEALETPRQRARFLCGITSPATTRAKLTREPTFGSLANRRFAEVLAWCEAESMRG